MRTKTDKLILSGNLEARVRGRQHRFKRADEEFDLLLGGVILLNLYVAFSDFAFGAIIAPPPTTRTP